MSEIHVGYIDKFDFTDDTSREQLSGHPKVGSVYQILKLDDCYHIHIGHVNTKAKLDGITLGPELSGNYMDKWGFKVDLLTKENYIDYPLSVEDMEKVSGWLESDHKELRQLLTKTMEKVVIADLDKEGHFDPINDVEAEKLNEAIAQTLERHLPVTKRVIESVSQNLNVLVFHNPLLLEAVNEVMTYVVEGIKNDLNGAARDKFSEEFLLYSPSKDVAVYNSMKNLEAYTQPPVVGTDDKTFLYKSIQYSLLELQRRRLQSHE